jgi:hypothetical protein
MNTVDMGATIIYWEYVILDKYTFYKQRQEALLFMTNTNITADNVDSIVSVEVINILEKNSQYPYGWYVWPNMLLSYYEPNCSNP